MGALACAIVDNFAGDGGSPPDVALALGISPTRSAWPALTGAAIAYGLIDGGINAGTMKLTILPSRPARGVCRRAQRRSRMSRYSRPPRQWREAPLTAPSTAACLLARGLAFRRCASAFFSSVCLIEGTVSKRSDCGGEGNSSASTKTQRSFPSSAIDESHMQLTLLRCNMV